MKTLINIPTQGNNDVINITHEVQKVIERAEVESGIVSLFVIGSTAGLSVIEHEPGLVKDIQEAFSRLIPSDKDYYHNEKWHDDNGYSHIRATILKPDLIVPFKDNRLQLGQWQQIILIDFDTKPREREVVVSVMSDKSDC